MESSIPEHLLVREFPVSKSHFFALSAAVFRARADLGRDTLPVNEMYSLLTGQPMNLLDYVQQRSVLDYCRVVGRIAHKNGLTSNAALADYFGKQADNLV